jgi:hypothetical protein
MKHLATDWEAQWSLVAAEGATLTIHTNSAAPRNRIVALDVAAAAEGALSTGAFKEVLAEHPKDLLQVLPSARLRSRFSLRFHVGASSTPLILKRCKPSVL